MTDFVYCRTQFEGFHRWSQAPEAVSFLRDRHRHVFHVKAWVEIHHDDREVEFILLKRKVDSIVAVMVDDDDLGSCEMIARQILSRLRDSYGEARAYKVDVSEDGENGAVVTGGRLT